MYTIILIGSFVVFVNHVVEDYSSSLIGAFNRACEMRMVFSQIKISHKHFCSISSLRCLAPKQFTNTSKIIISIGGAMVEHAPTDIHSVVNSSLIYCTFIK